MLPLQRSIHLKTPPAPPPPVYFNWTGCYIGGHVGGLWVSREFTTLGGPFGHVDHDASGWLGGVQGGCDYQFAGGWVIGIQGDFAWTDAEGDLLNQLVSDSDMANEGVFATSVPIPLRQDFDAPQLRGVAEEDKDGPQARRLLALAAIYDGPTRTEAAKIARRRLFRIDPDQVYAVQMHAVLGRACWHRESRASPRARQC